MMINPQRRAGRTSGKRISQVHVAASLFLFPWSWFSMVFCYLSCLWEHIITFLGYGVTLLYGTLAYGTLVYGTLYYGTLVIVTLMLISLYVLLPSL
jgi:hypothetical protein